jgi:hypothetical protein
MASFDLVNNPFSILAVSPRSKIADIEDAFEDAIIDDPQAEPRLLRTKQELLTPATRLSAELAWLSELAPTRSAKIILQIKARDLTSLKKVLPDLPPLSRANLAADCAERFGSVEVVGALIQAHSETNAELVAASLNSIHSAAGFTRVDAAGVSDAIRALRRRHAAAALSAIVAQAEPARALALLLEEHPDPHDPFLRDLMGEYDQWSSPHLGAIEEDVESALASVLDHHHDGPERLIGALKAWDELCQPAQIFAHSLELDEERSLRIYRKVRGGCIDLANDQGRYEQAREIAAVMLDLFKELPTALNELAADIATLKNLTEQASLEQRLEALKAALLEARENVRLVAVDLKDRGFGSAGCARVSIQLRQAFSEAVADLSTSKNRDLPLVLVRSFALDLHNEDNETAASRALIEAVIEIAPPHDPELASRIEADLKILRDTEVERRLIVAVEAKHFNEASHIIDDMLREGAGDRVQLLQLQAGLKQRRNKRLWTWFGWGAAAVFVIYLVSNEGGSGSSTAPDPSAGYTVVPESSSASELAPAYEPQSAEAPTASSDELTAASSSDTGDSVSMPPTGTENMLDPSQLRYCAFEKVRLTAMQPIIENGGEQAVSQFNLRVDDYNSRCGSFRYQGGDLEAARSAASLATPQLTTEAEAQAREWLQ